MQVELLKEKNVELGKELAHYMENLKKVLVKNFVYNKHCCLGDGFSCLIDLICNCI